MWVLVLVCVCVCMYMPVLCLQVCTQFDENVQRLLPQKRSKGIENQEVCQKFILYYSLYLLIYALYSSDWNEIIFHLFIIENVELRMCINARQQIFDASAQFQKRFHLFHHRQRNSSPMRSECHFYQVSTVSYLMRHSYTNHQ